MLSKDQIDQFETRGYLVVENVLDEDALGPVKAEYAELMDRLCDGWRDEGRLTEPLEGLDFYGKLMAAHSAGCDWFPSMDISLPGDRIMPDSPFHFGPAVFNLLTAPRLLDLAEDLLGPEITSNPIQHVRIKVPGGESADPNRPHIMSTDWHQDRGVALEEADSTRMVTAWVAVTDATVENGCLKVIPMERGQEMLTHCPKRQTSIPKRLLDESLAVPLPVRAGGVVLFHPLVPHASLPNVTADTFRWSFDLRYNVTGDPTGRAHFPDFVARSRSRPETELRDWRTWLAMWEAARERLAEAPHIDIHRWSGDAAVCA